MADQRVSDLPQIGSITDSTLFVVEKNATAYHATAAQVKALIPSGEGGTGTAALVLDFTGVVTVNSAPDDLTAQGFDVEADQEILLQADRVLVRYADSYFPNEVLTAEFTSRQYDENDGTLRLWASPMNMYRGAPAVMRLAVDTEGAKLVFWPSAQEQADAAETDTAAPDYIKNNPVKVSEDGYTEIENERQVTAIDFTNWTDDFTGSFTVTLQGGVTTTVTQGSDESGNKTLSVNGNTVTLTGV